MFDVCFLLRQNRVGSLLWKRSSFLRSDSYAKPGVLRPPLLKQKFAHASYSLFANREFFNVANRLIGDQTLGWNDFHCEIVEETEMRCAETVNRLLTVPTAESFNPVKPCVVINNRLLHMHHR